MDELLVQKALVSNVRQAQALILSGRVLVDNQRIDKPGTAVALDGTIRIKQKGCRYVSRGGLKLEAALEDFKLDPEGWTCVDLGSSTGGFVDCLLQHGARLVYAVDVGRGQLDWKLQCDPRVRPREGINARFLKTEHVESQPDLVTVDLSFISLLQVLPAVKNLEPDRVLVLIKPQFEARREEVGEGGVIHDAEVRAAVLKRFLIKVEQSGWRLESLLPSPVKGQKGNQEYLALLEAGAR